MPIVRRAAMLAAVVAIAACSGDDPATTTSVGAPGTAVVATAPDDRVTVAETSTTLPQRQLAVSLVVSSETLGFSAELAGEVAGDADLFGEFATCSAFSDWVGAYLVGVGDSDGDVRRVSVATSQRVTGAGTYDADVRVELRVGDAVDAVGSVSLADGLASGTFSAVDAMGVGLEGSFECSGDDTGPNPVATADSPVEVVALVRRGDEQRVVGLAGADPAVVSCPAVRDGVIVRAEGDVALGSIQGFELAIGASGTVTLRMRVGATLIADDDVELVADDPATAGSFSAAMIANSDAMTVGGAFSCG